MAVIKEFKDNPTRNSGIIFNSLFEQVKEMYVVDPVSAGELAISAIELVLTGDISTDNYMIGILLKPFEKINENNQNKYDQKVENIKNKKMAEYHLEEIAKLVNQGETQTKIGQILNISQQTVSKRVKLIKEEYSHLLQPKNVVTTKNGCTPEYKVVPESTNSNEVVKKEKIGFYF